MEYKREWMVLIDCEAILGLKVMTLLGEIETVVGHGALLALRPRHDKNILGYSGLGRGMWQARRWPAVRGTSSGGETAA